MHDRRVAIRAHVKEVIGLGHETDTGSTGLSPGSLELTRQRGFGTPVVASERVDCLCSRTEPCSVVEKSARWIQYDTMSVRAASV